MDSVSLADLPVLVLDCQATGATPAHGHLLEIAWAAMRGRGPVPEATAVTGHLVALPDGARLPRQVSKLTGLSREDLRAATPPQEVWRRLTEAAAAVTGPGPTLAVAHWSRFERAFVKDLHQRFDTEAPAPLELAFCTHEIATRLLPDLPRRGLHALAGYFGYVAGEHKRAVPHVHATALVWYELVRELDERCGVRTRADLATWMKETRANRRGGRGFPMPRDVRLGMPKAPGVYRMLARGGRVLYVGKATNLQRRLNSYWQKRKHGNNQRTMELLTQVRDVDVTVTGSTLEAALLETDEIKRHDPPYNVALRLRSGADTWFLSPDLQRLAPSRDAAHPLGPLPPSAETVDLVGALAPWLAGADLDVEAARRALGFGPSPDPDVLRAGFDHFVATHGRPFGPTPLAALHRVGARLWELAALEEDEEEDEDEGDTRWRWDPERVASSVEKGLMRAAHLLRRGPWLVRLSEASIAFAPKGVATDAWRLLVLREGRIAEACDVAPGLVPPAPPPTHLPARLDATTYDRLRVLNTELRRLVGDGAPVLVRTGSGKPIQASALASRLSWL